MKDPEEAIERLLTRLRDAEAPAGMDTRILGALAVHAARQNAGSSWRGWMAVRRYAWPVAGGAVAAAVCGVVLLVSSSHRVARVTSNGVGVLASSSVPRRKGEAIPQRLKPRDEATRYGTAEAVPLSKAAASSGKTDVASGNTDVASGKTDVASENMDAPSGIGARFSGETAGASFAAWRAVSGAFEGTHEMGAAGSEKEYELLAMSEMLAPSKPAPPLPLTHQEKMLAQVVHKGDPEQVADLEPEVRAKQIEMAKAEFHEFFQSQLVKDNE